MSAEAERKLDNIERKLEELSKKAEELELLAMNSKPESMFWQLLVATRMEIVELRKKENILLSERQPAAVDKEMEKLVQKLDQKLEQVQKLDQKLEQKLDQKLAPLVQAMVSYKLDKYLQPSDSSASGGSKHGLFHSAVLKAYQAERITADGKEEIWCVVTGVWWPKFATISKDVYVTAAHIFKRGGPTEDWSNLHMLDTSVDTAHVNGLPIMTYIERCFDHFQVIVIPTAVSLEHPLGDYKVYILDPSLLDVKLYDKWKRVCNVCKSAASWIPPASDCSTAEGWPATDITFRQLHGRSLQFGIATTRPLKRLLTWHATLALLHAQRKRWALPADVPSNIGPDHPGWASPTLEGKLQQVAFWQAATLAASAELPETAGPNSDSYSESDAE